MKTLPPSSAGGIAPLPTSLSPLAGRILAVALPLLWAADAAATPRYVDPACAAPASPFATWATAATNIQDAVDAAVAGDEIIVTNGVYQTGGRVVYGAMTNRVAVTNALTLRSVNGPEVTIIEGHQMPVTNNGPAAIRCVYLGSGATLSGFTLTKGATLASGSEFNEMSGGGGWCQSSSVTLSNCVVGNNTAFYHGGGVYGGSYSFATLNNCVITNNAAAGGSQCLGGGAFTCNLNNCIAVGNRAGFAGGGSYDGTRTNCHFTANTAGSYGGGAAAGTLTNCMLVGNSSGGGGGGAAYCTLDYCTLTGNWTTDDISGGGAAFLSTLHNCTLASNRSGNGGGTRDCYLYDCTLTGNYTFGENRGGGGYGSTFNNCVLTTNSAGEGGGAFAGTLNNCLVSSNSASTRGGGSCESTLNRCTLTRNSARNGGGAYSGTLNNCALLTNSADYVGGGACSSTLKSCTVISNSATLDSSGGTYSSTLINCIVYYNTGITNANNYRGGALSYCCTTPLPSGAGNFTNEPSFVDWAAGNCHLSSNSPCINAGNNASAVGDTDLDGNPRISGGTVDMGAYEFQSPASILPYAWLQQYGLPTDGSTDFTDPDHDGLNDWQEWVAGTDPTNATSTLRIVYATNSVSGTVVNWTSVTNRTYWLESSTNLARSPDFSLVQSNLAGQAGTTACTDTNASGLPVRFYRVGVAP
jgi:hypothetical protein